MGKLLFFFSMYSVFTFNAVSADKNQNIYIFIDTNQQYSFNIDNKEILPVEPNLFKIDKSSLNKISLIFKDCTIQLEKKYLVSKRFINLSLRMKGFDKDNKLKACNLSVITKHGDYLKYHNPCKDKNCIELIFEYPQIVTRNNDLTTTINPVFAKYIFEAK